MGVKPKGRTPRLDAKRNKKSKGVSEMHFQPVFVRTFRGGGERNRGRVLLTEQEKPRTSKRSGTIATQLTRGVKGKKEADGVHPK